MQISTPSQGGGHAPSPLMLCSEPVRAATELIATASLAPWAALAPAGDGHPVLVLPGLFAGDGYTTTLRLFLRSRGFAAQGWHAGLNLGHWSYLESVVLPAVERLHARHGQRVSIIGASMGGLLARAAARADPERVRCVITLGSALRGPHRANHVWPVYEAVTGQPAETLSQPLPPVPSTSIFSRLDGMSDWHPCVAPAGPGSESIAVTSSHHGLIHHAAALYAIADRLAQPPDAWRPFQPPRWAAALYGPLPGDAVAA
jgi:pimeloyl-ACP methyl ester carboxylesterase